MKYGHFDNQAGEYVIDRVDLPVSWTNYIGLKDLYGVFNHTAGGYLLYRSSEHHRITRFLWIDGREGKTLSVLPEGSACGVEAEMR